MRRICCFLSLSCSFIFFFTSLLPADGQTAGGGARGGGGVETIQVMFTPTICKVRCSQDRCVNYCERGNVTTLYSGGEGGGRRDGSHGPGFRVFLCPLLCKNGGVCLQKDRCLCPPNFTGKFCQVPVTPTDSSAAFTNEIVKPVLLSSMASNQELVRSEFLLPLGRDAETMTAGAPSGPLVKVRVQHPPEANVKVHQVKVSGFTPTLRTLSSSSSSGSAGAPAPAGSRVLAQTVRGDSVYTQQSGFKYCFREVKDGQCSSPLPGLRSKEMCCRGIGKAWGIDDCVICPENTGQSDASCPVGFERANGTQCVDVNECLQPGLCENGICVNTRGSYSCVCRLGFILDASHGICISQSVISEEKGQCYRVLGSGLGPSSCSLPILKSITKQICCCSRVGKAWGPDCQRCPYFGSVAFKEICPAGPGYQYSPSTLKFNQRVSELEGGGGAVLVNGSNKDNQGPVSGSRSPLKPPPSGGVSTSSATGAGTRPSPPQPQPQPHPGAGFPASSSSSSSSSRPVQPGSAGTSATQGRTRPSQSRPDSTQLRPQPPSAGSQAADRFSSVHRADPPPSRGDSLPAPGQPQSPERGSRPSEDLPLEARPPVSPTPPRVQTVRGVCESRPGVCGRGRCVDQPGGKHTCVCDLGFQLSSQRTHCQDVNECLQSPAVCSVGECVNSIGSYRCACPSGYRSNSQQTSCQDIDECQQNPCVNGRCDNTAGSYRCICRLGYRLVGNTCTDVDECADPLQCPGQECVNTPGSFRCVSCPPGHGLLNNVCRDVNECRQNPCSNGRCENTPGSYRCVCHHGYKLQNNTCTDVDECVSLPGVCGSARCENVEGSFMCECDQAGQSYDTAARQCVHAAALETDSVRARQSSTTTTSSSSFLASVVELSPMLLPLPQAHPGELRECYYNLAERGTCSLLATNTTQQECCCTLGQGWGLGCQYHPCPTAYTAEFLTLCPSGNGYVTEGPGAFSYRDVDECKRFHPEVCKNGVCVNNIPGYSCYCSSGYVYNSTLLECVDHDECEEESCVGGICVNTVGSYYCSCQPPLVLDDTQRNCVNSSDLNEDENLSLCWQHVTAGLMCQSALLGAQVTFTDCCCLYGQGWGMSCALCPATDTAEYASMCSSFPPTPLFPATYPDSETEAGRRRGSASPNLPPYGLDYFPEIPSRDYGHSDYDDYSPAEGSRSGFRGSLPDETYRRPEYSTGYYSEGDYGPPDSSQSRPPPFRIPPDPRADIGFGVQPDSPPLSLAPLPGGRYEETEEEAEDRAWRPGPPFPPFTDRSGGGGVPRRLYERRYESYASLSTAEDCGILHGCENGRCIRVAEGYTCDCYQGYELDMTTMTCIDVNECEDSVRLEFPCVNARCVNTDGSYRCVCRRGYVMSRRTNHCVAA
ncbi:latent-transforming growth factor beta-binding protein 4 isoform X6 [Oreochromis aureus]|uniref:latent-transforming growth factor beta-binding protein 4 isoform X6 n=1 Tax=Oreochromis aureus TaxID=47969 RepID=UPI001953456A|nr:latent-transforming growth factor beta-binding protein 4 isoform X6 [Oreochromis aureus]